MSEKVRIYELAKTLSLETKEMLAILDEMGVEYKSHSSTIEVETADTIRQLVEENRAEAAEKEKSEAEAAYKASLPSRAPVVTIMGHVDHGKTSLLDYIRNTKVASREAGGITQHIGAYQAQTPNGLITFLDTPGHEAFTTIRQRGANATDIAIIVVAADDSIMPQTREAVAHAKAANVPIIVAINKIDLASANPDKVMQDLMQVELIPEAYGGETITVNVSAHTGEGVDTLLEMISLVAEIEDYRADPEAESSAIVIESILDKQAGVLATVLTQAGTLRVGDYIVSGEQWAKIRAMIDYTGKRLKEVGPAVPVQILGFSGQPLAGDLVEAVSSEKMAKALTESRIEDREQNTKDMSGNQGITLDDLFNTVTVAKVNLILRADTQGSLEAIKGVIATESESTEEVDVEVLLATVGAPTEADLLLAGTADATVMSFGVNPAGSVVKAAEKQGIALKSYKIIYNLIEDVQKMIKGQIEPEFEEQVLGHAEVRMVISIPKQGNIAGSYVTDGVIKRGAKARLMRRGEEIHNSSVSQLKRFKDDVREVGTNFECGINLVDYDSFEEGDIIEVFEMVEVPAI